MKLYSPSTIQDIRERYDFKLSKSLGQNFITDRNVIEKIIEGAQIGPDDMVIEIGPGIGVLTAAAAEQAARVVAIEIDSKLIPILSETLAGYDNIRIVNQDVLKTDINEIIDEERSAGTFTGNVKILGNLPYYITSPILMRLLEEKLPIRNITVMVQKEVADRMAAVPGTKNYGAYTVKLGLYAEPVGRFAVGPGNFFPPPRVDSAVIRLNRRVPLMADGAPASPEVIAAAALMADAAFTNRRKTIANSCKTYFSGRGPILLGVADSSAAEGAPTIALPDGAATAERLPAIFEAAAIDPRRRGETLTQQEFLALGAALLRVTAA